ncbi:helix-turn-helix transcriptional regulator [Evansella cellulosilytica]|uniref:Transcriptional regulator protein-like protein n=1 Tax=Evansella cellulosilytica (strain ATCC 21833 / DSM 2522 / FERM P-1141 / JCM 9156 / N-4) TaxID=649639 RepID=E6TR31_EVAC2|nr:WYL domain-containing protein [Evansella cellulosilytica]ADU29407.1 transcriptional regulator protein-like protein [Evansella cellulosilytica DSM 2522]
MEALSNRRRLLMLMEILRMETDEEHELSVRQLKAAFWGKTEADLGERGLQDDLRELVDSDVFPVVMNHNGNGFPKYYSHQERLFEVNELRLLVDAVSSARFISRSDTEKLIGKIKQLTSKHMARQLKNMVLVDEAVKSENNHIKYYISDIHQAITEQKEIAFQYGRYNTRKQFILSRNGDSYQVKPYALIWNNDFYYLIGKYGAADEIRHYRVDRMRHVLKTEVSYVYDETFHLSEYVNQLFHMYSGDDQYIEIVFDNHLINVIIDRFGLNVAIKKYDENSFVLSTKAVISEGLVRWILTWGSDAKVLKPKSLVANIAVEAEKIYRNYH